MDNIVCLFASFISETVIPSEDFVGPILICLNKNGLFSVLSFCIVRYPCEK